MSGMFYKTDLRIWAALRLGLTTQKGLLAAYCAQSEGMGYSGFVLSVFPPGFHYWMSDGTALFAACKQLMELKGIHW